MSDQLESFAVVLLRRIDEKLDRVMDDVRYLKVRVTSLEANMAGLNSRMDGMEVRLDRIERRLDTLEG